MYAVAISNNDMVYLYWHVEAKIPGCLGFNIVRHKDQTGAGEPLPAMVGFSTSAGTTQRFRDTSVWPVQKYTWKDLFALRGGTYWYEIIPMMGEADNPVADPTRAMRTNSVTLSPEHGSCKVFFNRGIISTQAIAHALPKSKNGIPSAQDLQNHIKKQGDPFRNRLAGDLPEGVMTLLKRAEDNGGQCYCALYELEDDELVGQLLTLGHKASRLSIVLSNAGEDTVKGNGDGDSTNIDARIKLKNQPTIDLTSRILKKGHIGHNKFVVYVQGGKARAVLAGSTNWTSTGLCAQSNNAIIIESPELADEYWTYWKQLKADTAQAKGVATALQGKEFRSKNKVKRPVVDLTDSDADASGNIRVWFSPNTAQKSVPHSKKGSNGVAAAKTPPDLAEVFELIDNAKQGVLFLAFIPGNPSIVSKLKETYDAKVKAKQLFYLRGAATSPDPASLFRVDLYHRSSKRDATVRAVENPPDSRARDTRASAGVASVAGIFASFAEWEAEIYKLGFAVIHDKILVIDPFTDNSVVVTGSHNLGFRASYCNDENMLIIRNDRSVAEAYAAHVLDVYEHYRWRWRLQQSLRDALQKLKAAHPKAKPADLWKQAIDETQASTIHEAWQALVANDTWQDFYQIHKDFLAAEVNFWSPFSGTATMSGTPQDPAGEEKPRRAKARLSRRRPMSSLARR